VVPFFGPPIAAALVALEKVVHVSVVASMLMIRVLTKRMTVVRFLSNRLDVMNEKMS
jgi:hypothetical protein